MSGERFTAGVQARRHSGRLMKQPTGPRGAATGSAYASSGPSARRFRPRAQRHHPSCARRACGRSTNTRPLCYLTARHARARHRPPALTHPAVLVLALVCLASVLAFASTTPPRVPGRPSCTRNTACLNCFSSCCSSQEGARPFSPPPAGHGVQLLQLLSRCLSFCNAPCLQSPVSAH